jgi:hypothetical protein
MLILNQNFKSGHYQLEIAANPPPFFPASQNSGRKIEQSRVTEPKIGSPERKAIMDAMRGPVSKYAKTEIIFTGTAEVYEDWANTGAPPE